MASVNDVPGGNCVHYLSGGSPSSDAIITYMQPNETINYLGGVNVTYIDGEPGCTNPLTGEKENYGVTVLIQCNPTASLF
jgi:hypothetical protein